MDSLLDQLILRNDQPILHKTHTRELNANFAGEKHSAFMGLDPRINPDKPTRNFRDAMTALDKQAWAYYSKYLGCRRRFTQTSQSSKAEARTRRKDPQYAFKA